MTDKYEHHEHRPSHDHPATAARPAPKHWQLTCWILGIGSLIWLLLRSGTKPRRLAYPCQRIAAANSIGFLAYLAALLGSATFLRRLKDSFSSGRLALLAVGLLLTVFLQSSTTAPVTPIFADSPDLEGWTSLTAVSDVFVITDVPEPQYSLDGGVIPGGVSADDALHDDGVDALINLMEAHNDYFYMTSAHPDGLFGSNDVIVIKINNQWGGRNGTNTDVVKGVIYRLVSHPEGFTGAVIIAENAQNAWEDNSNVMNGSDNNSQFQNQSYQEVADAFAGEGYAVCTYLWDDIQTEFVDDYGAGSNDDGYVLLDADDSSEEQGSRRLSYPKFQVNCAGMNLQISMKQGLWNGSSFDNARLKMINLPVLKRHNCAWATIAVKNYLGFITIHDGIGRWGGVPEEHCWFLGPSDNGYGCTPYTEEYGLIARQMARVRRADLDIVDAIWVNRWNNLGDGSLRQDVLLASRDPFAVDYYASDYVLYPLVEQSGYTSEPEQTMASHQGGWFRNIQLRNVARLRAEGITDTINMDDSMTRNEELAQFNVYVADATEPTPPPTPTLALQAPNGGETWEIGTQQQIQWSSTGEVGDVHLEYSTDGFTTTHLINASTANDGAYTWTIPDDPSTNALVRVSSTLSATISDTSDAAFTLAGPHSFEDSFKKVSHASLEGGETITYTIVLYEETEAMLVLTDTIPLPCTYVFGSADIEPAWKGPVQDTGSIYWSGTVTGTVPVTVTFQAQVPVTTTTWTIVNCARISRDGAAPVERRVTSILNGFSVYLPLVLKGY